MNNIAQIPTGYPVMQAMAFRNLSANPSEPAGSVSADSFSSGGGTSSAPQVDLRDVSKLVLNRETHPFDTIWSREIPGNRRIPAISTKGGDLLVTQGYTVSSLDSLSGRMKWEVTTEGLVEATPAVGTDGTVYVASKGGTIDAVDFNSGVVLWEKNWFQMAKSSFSLFEDKEPCCLYDRLSTASDGSVYGASPTRVFALDGKTGEMKWNRKFKKGVEMAPLVSPADGTVVTGVMKSTLSGKKDFYLVGLDGKTGDVKWEIGTQRDFSGMPSTMDGDGNVFLCDRKGIAVYDSRTGRLVADISEKQACDLIHPPEIDENGTLYVANQHTDAIVAYEKDSAGSYNAKWTYKSNSSLSVPPLVTGDGTLIAGAHNGDVVVLDRESGKKMGGHNVQNFVVSVPQKGYGNIYFFDTNRGACALRLESDRLDRSGLDIESVISGDLPNQSEPQICDSDEFVEIDGVRLSKKQMDCITVFPGLLR